MFQGETNAAKREQQIEAYSRWSNQHSNVFGGMMMNQAYGAAIGGAGGGGGLLPVIYGPNGVGGCFVGSGGITTRTDDNFTVHTFSTEESKKKESKKMGFVRDYFKKHQELFMGLAVAIILDRYLLGGAFQERLKRIINGLLDKTEKTLADHKQV